MRVVWSPVYALMLMAIFLCVADKVAFAQDSVNPPTCKEGNGEPWRCESPLRHVAVAAIYDGGLGGLLRFRYNHVAAELGGLFTPFFTIINDSLEFRATATVTGHLGVYLSDVQSEIQHGFVLGYRYNTLFKHGGDAAYRVEVSISRQFAVQVGGGIHFFPEAESLIENEFRVPDINDFVAALTIVQPFVSVAACYYFF